MAWYAARTIPGAQQPQREYWPEPSASALKGSPRGKGYRIATSLNPEQSAVERALERAGFVHYMPAEFVAVRNRHKKGLYDVRRYALMKGYVFIGEMRENDWQRLLDVPGIRSVVTDLDGYPYPINMLDIHRLRMYEHNSRQEATAKAKKLAMDDEKTRQAKRKIALKGAKRKLFPGRDVVLIWGDKTGREATVQAWHDQDQVRVLLRNLDASLETVSVPYNFLKPMDVEGLTGTDG